MPVLDRLIMIVISSTDCRFSWLVGLGIISDDEMTCKFSYFGIKSTIHYGAFASQIMSLYVDDIMSRGP